MANVELRTSLSNDSRLARSNGNGTLGGLLRELAGDVTELAKSEVSLVKLELQQSLKRAAVVAAGAVLGGIVALFGLGLLCMTAVIAIEPLVAPLWARMLVMSAVYLLAGSVLTGVFLARLKRIEFGAPAATEQARQIAVDVRREVRHD